MKPKRHFKPANYWQHHIQAWAESGLSQKAYCTAHQIAPSTFYKWRRKLQDNLQSTGAGSVPVPTEEAASRFLEISAVPEPTITEPVQHWDIELQLGPQLILRMSQR